MEILFVAVGILISFSDTICSDDKVLDPLPRQKFIDDEPFEVSVKGLEPCNKDKKNITLKWDPIKQDWTSTKISSFTPSFALRPGILTIGALSVPSIFIGGLATGRPLWGTAFSVLMAGATVSLYYGKAE